MLNRANVSRFFYSAIFVVTLVFAGGVLPTVLRSSPVIMQDLVLPEPGGAIPVQLKIFHEGKLILESHVIRFIEKGESLNDPQKEWDLFLKSQKNTSPAFSPTTFFTPSVLKDAPEAKGWKIFKPDPVRRTVSFSDSKRTTFDASRKIQLHVGGDTIVLLSSIHLQASGAKWLVDIDKIAYSEGRRFVFVEAVKPKREKSSQLSSVPVPDSILLQGDGKVNQNSSLERQKTETENGDRDSLK